MTTKTEYGDATWEPDGEGDVRVQPPGEDPMWLTRGDLERMLAAVTCESKGCEKLPGHEGPHMRGDQVWATGVQITVHEREPDRILVPIPTEGGGGAMRV